MLRINNKLASSTHGLDRSADFNGLEGGRHSQRAASAFKSLHFDVTTESSDCRSCLRASGYRPFYRLFRPCSPRSGDAPSQMRGVAFLLALCAAGAARPRWCSDGTFACGAGSGEGEGPQAGALKAAGRRVSASRPGASRRLAVSRRGTPWKTGCWALQMRYRVEKAHLEAMGGQPRSVVPGQFPPIFRSRSARTGGPKKRARKFNGKHPLNPTSSRCTN